MSRFSKGTTDHDNDGRMGGSRKGESAMAKASSKKPAASKAAVKDKQAAVADQFAEADAKADPAAEVSEADLQVQRQVRGF